LPIDEGGKMKRSFLLPPALLLTFCAIIALIGCESAIDSTTEADALNVAVPATVSGSLAVIDGEFAVLYQGSAWYVQGLANPGFAEGTALMITGEAVPILTKDAEGNSLFFGYYLQAETVTAN
jgi:hypothetical protein